MTPDEFVERWKNSGGAELANSQSFLKELCDLLQVPQPDPTCPDAAQNRYVFEKAVEFNNGDGTVSFGRVDLFRSGCFVLESKQGSERKAAEAAEALATATKTAKKLTGTAARGTPAWDKAMQAARRQAKGYAEAIPDEWPPFLIVVDVGYCFDLYADFSGSGKNYVPFPDPRNFRIRLDQLREETVRTTLRSIWMDPKSLDPSKHAAKVTRDIAERLAKLAKSLEGQYEPAVVAGFLMRCLFTMFVEDAELIRKDSFKNLLVSLKDEIDNFQPMVESLWEAMDHGKFSTILREKVKRFNGKFFKDRSALPLNQDQLQLLIEAASMDWQFVEPSIFGTLLERALDPVERHKLGAHFTPRAYVERLVIPTIIEPLREEWDSTYAAAIKLDEDGKRKEAVKLLQDFHNKLCSIRVLDPACGSGNFLYVAMELMKRLEGEVLAALASFDDFVLTGITIDPHQFLGIEINPRAAAIAELVLWIGFIQWHRRTRVGNAILDEPILKDYGNIQCRDALLEWDAIAPVVDASGNPVTRWDGRTTKPHPITGEEVPDDTARVQELRYINPRKADWPKAQFIVGNPPFIGTARMREALGDGYTKIIRTTYSDIPESCDFVMYWWHKAALRVREGKSQRFGLITTNSLRQTFNRRVVAMHLEDKVPLSLHFAIPDHPWVDSELCAAVRIAMSVGVCGEEEGTLVRVESEEESDGDAALINFTNAVGKLQADLRIGADVGAAKPLASNQGISSRGVQLIGSGFIVNRQTAESLGYQSGKIDSNVIREYRNGRDITQSSRDVLVIDLFGYAIDQVRELHPSVFQHVLNHVKPERDQNNRKTYRDNWWIHGEPRTVMRRANQNLNRYIATVETSKHRYFVFLGRSILPDNMLISIAVDDAFVLGVLSSRIHVLWALATGGRLGVGNDPRYNKTRCFETFPFPETSEATKKRIGELAEQLDSHRKRQQERHPALTMTGMYNVLEKLRLGDPLTAKEKTIHEQGLVSVLKQIHDDLDAAVFDAYGWPHDLDDEEILQRLVDLNRERAEEESRGIIRWLRPEFQNPAQGDSSSKDVQRDLDIEVDADDEDSKQTKKASKDKAEKQPWPKTLPEKMAAVQSALQRQGGPTDAKKVAASFARATKTEVDELLKTLVAVGNVRQLDDGRFAPYK